MKNILTQSEISKLNISQLAEYLGTLTEANLNNLGNILYRVSTELYLRSK